MASEENKKKVADYDANLDCDSLLFEVLMHIIVCTLVNKFINVKSVKNVSLLK